MTTNTKTQPTADLALAGAPAIPGLRFRGYLGEADLPEIVRVCNACHDADGVDRDPAAAEPKLTELRQLEQDALAEMRALIFELRPGDLEEGGLVEALRTRRS